jgi:hypothetical protein
MEKNHEGKQLYPKIQNCLENLKLVKIVRLEKQSRRTQINSGYKVSRIQKKNFTLKLVQLRVNDFKAVTSDLC